MHLANKASFTDQFVPLQSTMAEPLNFQTGSPYRDYGIKRGAPGPIFDRAVIQRPGNARDVSGGAAAPFSGIKINTDSPNRQANAVIPMAHLCLAREKANGLDNISPSTLVFAGGKQLAKAYRTNARGQSMAVSGLTVLASLEKVNEVLKEESTRSGFDFDAFDAFDAFESKYTPIGICLSHLGETDTNAREQSLLDFNKTQVYNVAIEGVCLASQWTGNVKAGQTAWLMLEVKTEEKTEEKTKKKKTQK